jgi:surface polysaccharide O-acyltransferase-like enzyme
MIIRNEYFSLIETVKIVATLRIGWGNHIWYLRALVIIYTILPLIKVAYDCNKKIFYYFCCLVIILTFGNVLLAIGANIFEFILGKNYINGHFDFFTSINVFHGIHGYSIGYFLLGGIFFNYKDCLYRIFNRLGFNKLVLIFIILGSMMLLMVYGIIMSKSNGELFDVVFTGYATIFTLINVLSISCLVLDFKSVGIIGKTVKIIGENTLGIYLTHVFTGSLLIGLFKSFKYSNNIIANILFAFVILILSLLISIILKKIPIIKELLKI